MKSHFALAAAALIAAMLGWTAPAAAQGTLSLYCGVPEEWCRATVNAFTRQRYKATLARERDDRSVALSLPGGCKATRFLAEIGDLKIEVETPARVVIDERTGTVVIGEDVQISRVAVTHGALTVRITETPEVSQPAPFSNGRTVIANQTTINASQQEAKVAVLAGPTLKQLVRGLNQVGLRPTGIISILQAIKTAGALQADLVIQ